MISKLFLVMFGPIMMVIGTITYLRNRRHVREYPAEMQARAEDAARNTLIFTLLIGSLALITAAVMQTLGVHALFSGTQRDFDVIMGAIMMGYGVLAFVIMSWKQRQLRQQAADKLSEHDTRRIEIFGRIKYTMLGLFVFWGLLMLL